MIVSLFLAILLVASLTGNLRHFAQSMVGRTNTSRHFRHNLDKVTIEYNRSRNNIAVVDINGIITDEVVGRSGESMVSLISEQLRLAGEDPSVKAVILKVDSPGGEVLASDDIAREISEFQSDYDKPVVASMGGVAASGGYYVSAPCRWIVANELTITGSIGVIMHSYNYRGLMDKVGVQPNVFKSGKFKDMLSGEKPMDEILPEERQMVQELIDETYARFKKVVADGRNADAHKSAKGKNGTPARTLVENWVDYADGRVLSGKHALELGLVDELGNFDTAVETAETLAGINDSNLIEYEQPFDLGNLLRLFGQTESRALKIDLGFQLPKLQMGRLYFLSPTVVH
ncbi:MAG TPA: signal peptide peptidase SppA [Candidatus Nitrosotalea sp.]|nr:signal peptide peptidase SppA [Candidatus Nitrosotalea sp.]